MHDAKEEASGDAETRKIPLILTKTYQKCKFFMMFLTASFTFGIWAAFSPMEQRDQFLEFGLRGNILFPSKIKKRSPFLELWQRDGRTVRRAEQRGGLHEKELTMNFFGLFATDGTLCATLQS